LATVNTRFEQKEKSQLYKVFSDVADRTSGNLVKKLLLLVVSRQPCSILLKPSVN